MASSLHFLRGEDADTHTWTFDRLPEDLQPSACSVRAGGGKLSLQLNGEQHHWDLPADVNLQGPSTAELSGGKLTVTFTKKPNDGSVETLHRLRLEAMADNRMQLVNVTESK